MFQTLKASFVMPLFLFATLGGAQAQETPEETAPKPASLSVEDNQTASPQDSEVVDADGSEPQPEEASKEGDPNGEEQAVVKNAPSDGSTDGERLAGLDTMGKIHSAAELAGASGELQYQVQFDLPAFRELEPKLGLIYNSQLTSRTGAESVVGSGWQIRGLSSIERVSARRGAPTYQSGKDIFLLDGMEMLKCSGSSLNVAGSSISYASSHVKSNASAGCSAGGDFTTLNETYFRIKYSQSSNSFTLTQKNGVKFTYQSIHALAPSQTVSGDAYKNMRERRKWLLTRIEDTQANKNRVTFSYKFDTAGKSWYWQGYPERPHRIEYADYRVEFHYKQQSKPVATFTTGTQYLGRQYQLLEAVTIKRGSSRIRAYDLAYHTAPETKAKLLRAVKQIGNNFSVQSNGSVTGSALPAYRFEYNDDGYSVANRWYENFNNYVAPTKVHDGVHSSTGSHGAENGETFHSAIRTVETNGDGIDEILALDLKPNGTGNPHYRERSGHYIFDKNGNMSRNTAAYAIPVGRGTDGGSYSTFLGMNRWTPDQNRPLAIVGQFVNTDDKRYLHAKALTAGWYNHHRAANAHARDRIHWLTGNFDGDPETEVMIRDTIFDIKETASNGAERFPAKNLTRTTHSQCTGRTWVNARVVDVNGDGIDDVVFKAKYNGKSDQYCIRIVNENGYVDKPYSGTRVITCCANVENRLYWSFGFGDFNGDGVMDSVRFGDVEKPTTTAQLDLEVAFGHGDGTFSSRQSWFENVDMWGDALSKGEFYANAVIPTDLNGDGLDDVVVFAGYDDGTYSWTKRKIPGPIRMFLSTGSGFVETKMFSGGALIGHFGTIGDFNGDGVKDLAFGDSTSKSRPRILFGNSVAGHRITKITTNLGETVNVSYKPSTHFPGDQTPYVRQLVHKVTSNPGIGGARTVTFSYKNGRFDYAARKPLGFQEIQIKMPRTAGETSDLVQVTQYLTGHIAEVGLISRQYLKFGSTIYQDTRNTWSIVKSGKGPYRNMKTRERVALRHGNRLIYRQKDYTYNQYNEKLTEIDRGLDGGQDDVSVAYRYNANTSAYIVNKIAVMSTVRGASPSTSKNNSNRIATEYFQYDGRGVWETPTRGNATQHKIWNGVAGKDSSKIMARARFDDYGNVIEESNALGHKTVFTFNGSRRLFEASVTNAVGHKTTTSWNVSCQKPSTTTDPNGLVTSYTYDAHCRETRKRVSWGSSGSQVQDYVTKYQSFGNATAQHVEKSQKSSNTASGQLWQYSRQYFDGMGKVYKETRSGSVSSINQSSVTVRSFDKRGRTAWESIPISWADASDNVANSNQRISYSYDPLGRPTQMVFADGAKQTTTYTNWKRTYLGQETYYPQVNLMGAQCYDGKAATVCEESQKSVDADGNLIFFFQPDRARTDVASGNGFWRMTRYEYNHLNQLTRVVDPAGLVYTYKYDAYGNRTEQTDPGLGRWRMEYYADNSLKRQIDAKGQEIYFWYDELGREERKRVQLKNSSGGHVSYTNTYSRYDGEGSSQPNGYYYKGFLTKQWTDGPNAHIIENRYDRRGNVVWQNNTVSGKTYNWMARYTVSGQLERQTYFDSPGSVSREWTPTIGYDSADRQVSFGSYITSTTYDLWGNMTERRYGNNARTVNQYNVRRGWVTQMRHYDKDNKNVAYAIYTKSASGRVTRVNSVDHQGDLEYTYDYAGRLLEARYYGTRSGIDSQVDQTFTYDRSGRMRSNSKVGVYNYPSAKSVGGNGRSIHGHAPSSIVNAGSTTSQNLQYDANGNMTRGLHGKVMSYDGENRPLSVTYNGNTTQYVYGADGSRLKMIEKVGTSQQTTTVYLNGTEIRNFGQGSANEELLSLLSDEVRLTNAQGTADRVDYLHYDQLGSVIGLSNASGKSAERRAYHPFGRTSYERQLDLSLAEERKGFIGEYYDADAGLQYLNARYYDPELGLFIQPDWFEVTETGVGTNRYAYAGNDPVNKLDPEGNFFQIIAIGAAIVQAGQLIYTLATLPATVTQIVAAVKAGQAAQIIGQMVIDYAIDKAISQIPYFGKFIPASVRGKISSGVTRLLSNSRWNATSIGESVIKATCGLNSFEGSTLVQTSQGRKRIDSLLLGQMVLSKDEVTGIIDFRKVTKQHVAEYKERFDVTVRDYETGQIQVLKSSWSHPFFARVPENTPLAVGAEGLLYRGDIAWGRWIDAKDLEPGYELQNEDETWAEVISVEVVEIPLTAYNLTVEEFHTFYVAANDNAEPVWVHNTCRPPHGNSVNSPRSQHLYEISNPETGQVLKTGVSGAQITPTGLSPRAQSQLTNIAQTEGVARETLKVDIVTQVPAGPGARQTILSAEKANAARLLAEGRRTGVDHLPLHIHKRPREP